jgi:hypothetical protein
MADRIDRLDSAVESLKIRLTQAETDIRKISVTLNNIKGSPFISAYVGCQLKLNDSLDVQNVLKQLRDLDTILQDVNTTLQEHITGG